MSTQRRSPEELFETAVAAARDQSIDPQIVDAARDRVARRLAAELDGPIGLEEGADKLRPYTKPSSWRLLLAGRPRHRDRAHGPQPHRFS